MKTFRTKALVFAAAALMSAATESVAQTSLPSLHVEGKNLVDTHGNPVVLHGVMDTPNPYFNNNRWGTTANSSSATLNACISYFDKLYTAITDHSQGAYANVFRLHLDPCWTNDPTKASDGKYSGEADISRFSLRRLQIYLQRLYYPLMQKAMSHGLYVVVRPPGVCPDTIRVGGDYQKYLQTVWSTVASNDSIQKYAGQISIELANEPVTVVDSTGQATASALHDFFQPVIDTIRASGFSGVIWVPGRGWQSNYEAYASYPPEDNNYGYAVHAYVGWYNQSDANADSATFVSEWKKSIPVVENRPVIVTEVDWSPEVPGAGHTDEHGNYVAANMGTWATGTTSHWGKAFKGVMDYYGNISMTLSGTACYIDIDKYLADGTVTPAFNGEKEACGEACFEWYKDYAAKNYARPDFSFQPTGDNGDGTYTNPVIPADFPDVDVVCVDGVYYMATTTMHLFPGCTVLKSTDLVNWEYCANPLKQLSVADKYNLENNKESYAQGMWACSMKYHDGKFYILINGNDAGGFILTATDPEGEWTMKPISRIYYDPGMLFDNGKVYVACGNSSITICELDEDFNFIREKTVLSNRPGLEGSHFYKIGDYYYIYATYGGWPSGQAAFRSKDVFGPYEEKVLLEKNINGNVNTVHQGSLIQTPRGEWWTMLFEDDGAIGRRPNLQPVKWVDDWPVIGDNGVPYKTYKKPAADAPLTQQALPTTDNFRSYPLGMQWQWNHNPDNSSWSLFEHPGYLRLYTASVATDFMHARNTLTQRIFTGYDNSKPSTGTIRIDVSGMKVGDRAGIAIQQDPYALIGVSKTADGLKLIWQQDTLDYVENFTPAETSTDITTDSIIYLRAQFDNATSKTSFAYSLDNKTYTQFGGETPMTFNLAIFVGARFAIFNYATQETGGHVDVDWFSTEQDFEENTYYDPSYSAVSEDQLTVSSLSLSDTVEVLTGSSETLQLIATYKDGHTENVAANATFSLGNDSIVSLHGGLIEGLRVGDTQLEASYTDPMGNNIAATSTVVSTFFPFSADHVNTTIFGMNSYDASTRTFTPAASGQIGWKYLNGADMSAYKYLVIKLDKAQHCEGAINIYPADNIWGDCYSRKLGTGKQIVLSVSKLRFTSGDNKGQLLDPKSIAIIAFWGNGNGGIDVDDIYLTNNTDYSRPVTGISDITYTDKASHEGVFTLSGQRLRYDNNTDGLPAGVYIVGNRKQICK